MTDKRKECCCFWITITPEKKIPESCETLHWFPEYLNEVCPFKSEYNLEWKKYLLLKNLEETRKSINSIKRFSFYTPKIVKSVFNVCKMFRQPPEVRYLALDVLDRFLVEHFFKVSQSFEDMEEENLGMWQTVIERMLNQSPLRILTSVQLAMKYSWSCNIITAADIQRMLEFLGNKEQYPKKSILKSEKRIYKQLNYNANVAIIFHQQIYSNLPEIKQITTGDTLTKCGSTVSLKANFVVLAASVIFASSILEDPSTNTSKILLKILCSIGECRKSDIQELGSQLLNVIFK